MKWNKDDNFPFFLCLFGGAMFLFGTYLKYNTDKPVVKTPKITEVGIVSKVIRYESIPDLASETKRYVLIQSNHDVRDILNKASDVEVTVATDFIITLDSGDKLLYRIDQIKTKY